MHLLTPSKITAWLDCGHYLTLRNEVDTGARTVPRSLFGEMAQLLVDKGLDHERAVLNRFRNDGKSIHLVPQRFDAEPFAAWVERVGDPLADGHDVVFQMPFVHDGIRGIADFLLRVDGHEPGSFTYEPLDAKLARREAKPGHVLQLCFYAEAIAALTGTSPQHVHLALGSGATESVRVSDVAPYWRRLRSQLADLLATDSPSDTVPEPCDHCGFCEFELVCEAEWRAVDSLVHVADVRRADRALLEADGVNTIAALAELDRPVPDVDAARLDRFVRQARLQVRARETPDEPPPFELLRSPTEADLDEVDPATAEPIGFAALPAPDEGDVFLDFEGHPFWRADAELFFLFGLIERDPSGVWTYRAFWAHDTAQEASAVIALVDHLTVRRERHPGMHVYHYNHTERSALERLTATHGVAELPLERLVKTGAFVDLLPVVKGAMQVGVESYGLKHVERLTGYERDHEIDQGAGAVVEYERWIAAPTDDRLSRIAAYNEDDVRALRALRDWLVDQRPADVPWRPAVLDTYEPDPELDQRIERLHAVGPGTAQHLMGDLLGYWRREKSAVAADAYRLSIADEVDRLESPSAIARLSFHGTEPRFSATTGKTLKWPAAVFSFPAQPVDADIERGSKLITALSEQEWAFYVVDSIDPDTGELRVVWNDECDERGITPTSLVHYSWYPEGAKLDALASLADELLDGEATRVGHAILRREPPRFVAGGGPAGGSFTADVDDICAWAGELDGSYVPIQGPPGTGKTFTGAHIVRSLVRSGLRVGVTAMSHAAIGNLMRAVVERFEEDGALDDLRAVRKGPGISVPGVDCVDDNGRCASGDYDVIAGTAWLFASPAMRDAPVDVLVVDEAGQLGLADALAATVSARDVILLGDPQQLPQVAQANHPDHAGVSVLEHLLGDALTVAPDRGVLLDTTRRLHPDVCRFVSDVMYGGKLTSHPSCHQQRTTAGTGLRWLRAEHDGRSTESPEEAALVAATIERLVGADWTDQEGVTRPLTAEDFMVVAPYNDQRRCIDAALAANPATAGVEVGTVDKFQGREAAVVIFSMATSSSDFMPRTADFLFSKNRLNVAVSRARCLAYLVCTDRLLDTRARDVEQMKLISALCAFVEHAEEE